MQKTRTSSTSNNKKHASIEVVLVAVVVKMKVASVLMDVKQENRVKLYNSPSLAGVFHTATANNNNNKICTQLIEWKYSQFIEQNNMALTTEQNNGHDIQQNCAFFGE